ncbi:MAG: DUF1592 domain-containing protein [Nannocystis sp.]|uniref:DUF1592 domain-containing protein n=1 Tax=Nannocystis sp. TaxID=1962667 RepID=UPI00242164D3|nr:DUF1592 domain-containing protein [Nannocystis sp.]MBK9757527.1 DUF1592 domain-containing protein [Nannocystis sp.]
MYPRQLGVVGLATACSLVLACYAGVAADGEVGEVGSSVTGNSGGTDAGESGGDTDETPAPPQVPAPTIRRLTGSEFRHSVQDLLGPVTLLDVEADSAQEGFFAVGAARVALSPAGVAQYEAALGDATAQAFADPVTLAPRLACVPALVSDTTCTRDAIASFGRRAWRRPLTGAELERYLGIAATIGAETGNASEALRYALWAILQSPNFLYRVEVGQASPADGGRLKFSAYEMASRLAFTLWNTLPDEALLDAAEREELAEPAGIAAQAARMIADPRAKQGVENFVAELYSLWLLDEKLKDDLLYPEWTPTLRAAMRDELLARIDDVVFTAPTDFFSLYDSRKVFVNNELAQVYGLPLVDPDAWRAAELAADSPRLGLIGSGLLLAMNSLPARTSATERGQFIAESLLCRTVPPPPPNVDTNLDKDDMGNEPRTLRQKLAPHRDNPACAGCHNITDPLGLALEHFDTMGRYREFDQGLVIDASGDLDGLPFADGAELATLLRGHPDAPGCLVRKLYTYAAAHPPYGSEAATLAAIEDRMVGAGNRFAELLLAMVSHDDFRFANPAGSEIKPDAPGPGDMP